MSTKKPRVILALEPSLYERIRAISKANGTTLSLTARDLIRVACQHIEELGLASLARARLKHRGRWVAHES